MSGGAISRAILHAVRRLDGLEQSLLHESYGFRLTYKQIAAARGWEEPMVTVRLARALEEVRVVMRLGSQLATAS